MEGCDWICLDYKDSDYESIPQDGRDGDCFEDKLADLVLNGRSFEITDYYAEGDLFADDARLDEEDNGVYTITLDRILKGCSQTSNRWEKDGYSKLQRILEDGGDYTIANALLQIIMFGEVIYG